MAFSLKVLAVKRCFLSLLEFSALIISSSFRKLFIESIALVSLHARQDRKQAMYRCTHRADLFNILLKTTRYSLQTRKTQKTPSSSQNHHAVLAAKGMTLATPKCGNVNLFPRFSVTCLVCVGKALHPLPILQTCRRLHFPALSIWPLSLSVYMHVQIQNMAFSSLKSCQEKAHRKQKVVKALGREGRSGGACAAGSSLDWGCQTMGMGKFSFR